jgi:hypothetical protein
MLKWVGFVLDSLPWWFTCRTSIPPGVMSGFAPSGLIAVNGDASRATPADQQLRKASTEVPGKSQRGTSKTREAPRREGVRMAISVPNGRQAVIDTFGDITKFIRSDGTLSSKWEESTIRRITLPQPLILSGTTTSITRITCHVLLVDTLRTALRAIDDAGKWSALGNYGGGFNFRPKRGSAEVSLHAWGIAWDFDPENNPLGSKSSMDEAIISIFGDNGFFWGGNFKGRKDPMHFQYATGV